MFFMSATKPQDAGIPARPSGERRRRRAAACLLPAWLAFWLTAAVQPCELPAAPVETPQSLSFVASSVGHPVPAEHPHAPAPGDEHCPDLSAVSPVPASAAAEPAKERSFGSTFATLESPLVPAYEAPDTAVYPARHPPPRIPLYLRNQRLLI
jgi:hypothetical protein